MLGSNPTKNPKHALTTVWRWIQGPPSVGQDGQVKGDGSRRRKIVLMATTGVARR